MSHLPHSSRPLFATLALSLVSAAALACECIGPGGKPVKFGSQANIIVWDAATRTEHFVRNAQFQSDAKDFGFIAPTPSQPDLSEASIEAFSNLAALQPVEQHFGCASGAIGAKLADGKAVDVVQQVDVAGYQATTLLASDAASMAAWMKANGYVSTPATEKWSQFYIAKGWYLTAFKVINKAQVAETGTVRMSFKTDQPFNPYYVPSDNLPTGNRAGLKLFFVSSGPYQATVGKNQPWREANWTASIPAQDLANLAIQLRLPASAVPSDAQVETFIDPTFPHATPDDLYFTHQGPNVPFLATEVAFAAVILWLLWRRLRPKRS